MIRVANIYNGFVLIIKIIRYSDKEFAIAFSNAINI